LKIRSSIPPYPNLAHSFSMPGSDFAVISPFSHPLMMLKVDTLKLGCQNVSSP
jgi:hypothetical protein